MRWTLRGKRVERRGTGARGAYPQGVNLQLVTFSHDSKIPFHTLHDAAALVFLKRVVLTDE